MEFNANFWDAFFVFTEGPNKVVNKNKQEQESGNGEKEKRVHLHEENKMADPSVIQKEPELAPVVIHTFKHMHTHTHTSRDREVLKIN